MSEHIYGDGKCGVVTCNRSTPVGTLLCRIHWRHLTPALRSEVNDAWRGWCFDRITLGDLREVQDRAVQYVSGS